MSHDTQERQRALRSLIVEYIYSVGVVLRYIKIQEYATTIKMHFLETRKWLPGLELNIESLHSLHNKDFA